MLHFGGLTVARVASRDATTLPEQTLICYGGQMTKLYALSGPDGTVRYVGKTGRSLRVRLNAHLSEARRGRPRGHKLHWLRAIGFAAEIDLIDEVSGNGSAEERELIASLRALGARLVNDTDGGEGTSGYKFTPTQRARSSEVKRGRRLSAEARASMSRAHMGKRGTFDGRTHSPETRAKMIESRAKRGPISEATREKMRCAYRGDNGQRGVPHSAARNAKQSATMKAKHFFRVFLRTVSP